MAFQRRAQRYGVEVGSTLRPLIGIAAHQALVGAGEMRMKHEVAGTPYVKSIRKAGGIPMLLPSVDPDDAESLLERVDALMLTGGADVDPSTYGADLDARTMDLEPERDARDIALARLAVERDIPTLAICRGSQVLNVALGGTLHQHIDGHSDPIRYNELVHEVEIDDSSQLAGWLGAGKLGVNSLHHQAVATTGPDARIVARAGDGTIEGIEAIGARAVGVQWHPELLRHRAEHLVLFETLVRLANQVD